MTNKHKLILRLEGIVILASSFYFYDKVNGNWILAAVLLLAVDAFIIGYVVSNRFGALTYNLGHSYASCGTLVLIGQVTSS